MLLQSTIFLSDLEPILAPTYNSSAKVEAHIRLRRTAISGSAYLNRNRIRSEQQKARFAYAVQLNNNTRDID